MYRITLFGIIYLFWILGWIVCSLVYIVCTKKDFAEVGASFPWLSTLSRIMLFSILWPLYVVMLLFELHEK